jgi:hypothetical protein
MNMLIYIGIGISFVIYWVVIPLEMYFCIPRPGQLWTDISLGATCTYEEPYSILLGTWNAIVDIYLLCLPIPVVWRLNMGRGRKLGVLSIFMLGFM